MRDKNTKKFHPSLNFSPKVTILQQTNKNEEI